MAFKPTVANRTYRRGSVVQVFVCKPTQATSGFSSGGTGHLTKFRTGKVPAPPMSSPYIFIHTFRIPFYWQMVTLSHTTAVNVPSFKYELVTKPWSFLVYFHSYKMRLLALLGPLTERNWQISRPFHTLQPVKPMPFNIPEAWKMYPFRAKPSRIGYHREYSRGFRFLLLTYAMFRFSDVGLIER